MNRRPGARETLVGFAGLFLLAAACSSGSGEADGESESSAAADDLHAGFVDSATCAACHPEEHASWTGSHHDLAMQVANAETVLADFDDTTFEHFGTTTRFFREGERFLVNTRGADGEYADFEVEYTFGVDPLQQYLVRFADGRVQCLTVAWDTERERWFSLYPDEEIPAGDPLHWTGRYQRWNLMCADCHSTNLVRGYVPETDGYETSFHEIDVGCQACHGPGADHVAWAAALEADAPPPEGDRGLHVNLRRGAAREQVDACAPCHSRRHSLLPKPEFGEPFLDGFVPQRLAEGLYHADGQILDEVYVYGSFHQSRMGQVGVACTDCHDPHSAKPWLEGDALCLQCHSESAPLERFPTLTAKAYDVPAHHHHPQDSEGARCVACHMPERTYMVVDPRRDHSFRVPRPDLTVKIGTPNACDDCHADQGAEWAAEQVAEWYPDSERGEHYGEALAAGREGKPEALEPLARIAGDTEQPAIVRATALDLLGGYGPEAAERARQQLADPDPLVRMSAVRALDQLPPEARVAGLPLLTDPIRSVRLEAARVAASVPAAALDEASKEALDAALKEFVDAQLASADQPWAHLNLGVLREEQGDASRAVADYRTALSQDPTFLPARFNLGTLLNKLRRNTEALEVLRGGLEWAPDEGELHYSIGLLLAEMERMEEAGDSLERAAELLGTARAHYNAGVALLKLGALDRAERALDRSLRLGEPRPDAVHAMALIHVQRKDWPRARGYAVRFMELSGGSPQAQQLLQIIDLQLQRR